MPPGLANVFLMNGNGNTPHNPPTRAFIHGATNGAPPTLPPLIAATHAARLPTPMHILRAPAPSACSISSATFRNGPTNTATNTPAPPSSAAPPHISL